MKRKEVFISFILACGLAALPLNVSAQKRLSAEEARQEERVQVEKWMGEVSGVYGAMWRSKVFTLDSLRMPIMYKVFGEKPADGRSLYISMHGGGSTPTAVNDQQWRNQIVLYAPKEGVYVAPRAPFDDWNMWFRPQMDDFFQQLIAAAVVEMDVNPDKVYLLGYSAGGDGVWRMAPRMADRWAAASMMAGHPGEASQLNLRNVPFMIWMGENDGAYNRNRLAAEKGAVMDSDGQSACCRPGGICARDSHRGWKRPLDGPCRHAGDSMDGEVQTQCRARTCGVAAGGNRAAVDVLAEG